MIKHSPHYKEIKQLLKRYRKDNPSDAKLLKRHLKRLSAFIKAETTRNTNMFLVERYVADYEFFTTRLENFVEQFLVAMKFVLTHHFMPEELKTGDYFLYVKTKDTTIIKFHVCDEQGFTYFGSEFGSRRYS